MSYMYPRCIAVVIKITLNSIQPTTLLQRWVGREHTKFVKVCCSKELNLIGPPSSSLGAMARAEALTLQWQWMGNGGGCGLVPISSSLNQRVFGFHLVIKQFCLFRTVNKVQKHHWREKGAESTTRHSPLFAAQRAKQSTNSLGVASAFRVLYSS